MLCMYCRLYRLIHPLRGSTLTNTKLDYQQVLGLWMINFHWRIEWTCFHQHSAWISGVSMTTVHSVMTTEEPPMARGTPWLPVGFLLRLSLCHGYKTIPSPLYLSVRGHAPNSSLVWQTHMDTHTLSNTENNTKTHIFRDTYMHSHTCNITLTQIKACMYIYTLAQGC